MQRHMDQFRLQEQDTMYHLSARGWLQCLPGQLSRKNYQPRHNCLMHITIFLRYASEKDFHCCLKTTRIQPWDKLWQNKAGEATTLHMHPLEILDITISNTNSSPVPAIVYGHQSKISIYVSEEKPPAPYLRASVWESDTEKEFSKPSEKFLQKNQSSPETWGQYGFIWQYLIPR